MKLRNRTKQSYCIYRKYSLLMHPGKCQLTEIEFCIFLETKRKCNLLKNQDHITLSTHFMFCFFLSFVWFCIFSMANGKAYSQISIYVVLVPRLNREGCFGIEKKLRLIFRLKKGFKLKAIDFGVNKFGSYLVGLNSVYQFSYPLQCRLFRF